MTIITKCLILFLSLTLPAWAVVNVERFPPGTPVQVCQPNDTGPGCTGVAGSMVYPSCTGLTVMGASTWAPCGVLPAGTTTVAPLIFKSGTNLTTPVSGAMEYDGKHLIFTTAQNDFAPYLSRYYGDLYPAEPSGTSNYFFGQSGPPATTTFTGGSSVDNISFGYNALVSLTATNSSNNTVIGFDALNYMTSNSNGNVALGEGAGSAYTGPNFLTTINHSLFLGFRAYAYANGDTNEAVIGYEVTGHGTNTVTIGNASITDTYLEGIIHGTSLSLGGASSSFIKGDGSLDSNTYITGNQTITASGDATGSGTTTLPLTLATVNSNVGSYTNANITVNAKGLVTAAANGSAGFVKAGTGINWTDLYNIPSNQTINWNGVIETGQGINWDTVKNLGTSGINWNYDVFKSVGINWDDIKNLSTSGINWQDNNFNNVKNLNFDGILNGNSPTSSTLLNLTPTETTNVGAITVNIQPTFTGTITASPNDLALSLGALDERTLMGTTNNSTLYGSQYYAERFGTTQQRTTTTYAFANQYVDDETYNRTSGVGNQTVNGWGMQIPMSIQPVINATGKTVTYIAYGLDSNLTAYNPTLTAGTINTTYYGVASRGTGNSNGTTTGYGFYNNLSGFGTTWGFYNAANTNNQLGTGITSMGQMTNTGNCSSIGPVGTCWTATGQEGYCSGALNVCTTCTAC